MQKFGTDITKIRVFENFTKPPYTMADWQAI